MVLVVIVLVVTAIVILGWALGLTVRKVRKPGR